MSRDGSAPPFSLSEQFNQNEFVVTRSLAGKRETFPWRKTPACASCQRPWEERATCLSFIFEFLFFSGNERKVLLLPSLFLAAPIWLAAVFGATMQPAGEEKHAGWLPLGLPLRLPLLFSVERALAGNEQKRTEESFKVNVIGRKESEFAD